MVSAHSLDLKPERLKLHFHNLAKTNDVKPCYTISNLLTTFSDFELQSRFSFNTMSLKVSATLLSAIGVIMFLIIKLVWEGRDVKSHMLGRDMGTAGLVTYYRLGMIKVSDPLKIGVESKLIKWIHHMNRLVYYLYKVDFDWGYQLHLLGLIWGLISGIPTATWAWI